MDRTTCQVCLREVENNKRISVSFLFGALSCKACQEFFRRTVQRYGREGLDTVFDCDLMDCGLGYRCQKNRLLKCLQCGMDPKRVVLDETKRKKRNGMIYNLLLICFRCWIINILGPYQRMETQASSDVLSEPSTSSAGKHVLQFHVLA